MRRTPALLGAVLLAGAAPSCSFSANVETLLSPPRLDAEQEQIYRALEAAVGTSISLRYPKSGERLSAFTVEDLDSDGDDEAIVFYEVLRDSSKENTLRLCLLNQENGQWRAVKDYTTADAEIERVDVERLGVNKRLNLIIRYGMPEGGDHTAEVFHYEDDELRRTLSLSYSDMAIRDLNGDGTLEILALTADNAQSPAAATAYALEENGDYIQSTLALPDAFTDIAGVYYAAPQTDEGSRRAVYVDGVTGAQTISTAILSYQDNQLSFVYADTPERFPNTSRPANCPSADVDADGDAEIPVQTLFYGYDPEAQTAPELYMTNWYECENGLLMRKYSSYYSPSEGYVFRMPARWAGKVTAVRENEEIVFYEYDPDTPGENGRPALKTALARVCVITDPVAADAMQQSGYLLLRRRASSFWLAKAEAAGGDLRLSQSELLFLTAFI